MSAFLIILFVVGFIYLNHLDTKRMEDNIAYWKEKQKEREESL